MTNLQRPTLGEVRRREAALVDAPIQTLRVGDSITHTTFGDGVIVDLIGHGNRCEGVVWFETHHTKRLLLSWSPVEKTTAREAKTQFTGACLPVRVRPRLDSPLEEALYDAMPSDMQAAVTTQHEVGRYRLDFAFVDEQLCVEVDGRTYHSDETAFTRDRSRDRWLMANGWRVLRFASGEVFGDPARCITEIAAMRAGT